MCSEMMRLNNTQYYSFLQQADTLRRSGSLCDVHICVRGQTFKAHRLVLACASTALARQLAQGDAGGLAQCSLDHLSPHTFQQVLHFSYSQTLEVPVADLPLLLEAAQQLEIQSLEEQCRSQLNNIESKVQQVTEFVKEKEEADNHERIAFLIADEKVDSRPATRSPISAEVPDHDTAKPPKKRRLSPTLEVFCGDRDSVITRNSSSSLSPCSFPVSMWSSDPRLDTLRQIAENYTNYITARPTQCSNAPSVIYPLTFSAPHMLPILSSHLQNSLYNSAIEHSAFHPCYSGNRRMIEHAVFKRRKQSQSDSSRTAEADDLGYSKMFKVGTETEKDSQRYSAAALGDSAMQDLSSLQTGCQFCGGGHAARPDKKPRGDSRGEKPYQCTHCPKKFSLKHQLDTHHRVHTGEKPFECRLCGQRSRDYSAMIKHLRTHGGASPYQCTACLEFCSSLVAMQRHIKSHSLQDFPPDWSINSTYLYISHI